MDVEFIERLIALVETSSVAELAYSENGASIRIVRGGGAAARPAELTATPSAAPAAAPARHTIAAGIVGTFYRRPAPDQPAFVSDGDVVEEGQTLAILEAMKTLNPVEADRGGRIVEILVEDGASVEAGTALFVLEPTD